MKYRVPVGGKVSDIAIMPTIRAAIMHAVMGKIEIKKTDMREKVRRRKVSILLIVVVDASSSMLEEGRLAAVRGVLDDLFMDAYQKRDRVALVHCGGGTASLLLSFAGNVESGRQAVERAPWGGTDALPAGLTLAAEVLAQKLRTERNALPVVVVISDGGFSGRDADEVTRLLDELSERAAVVCVDVGPQEKEEEPPMALVADAVGGGYLSTGPAPPGPAIPETGEVGALLEAFALTTVNPACGPALLAGFDAASFQFASDLVRENLWEVETVEGCNSGCAPGPSGELCPECRVARDAGALKTRTAQVPFSLATGRLDAAALSGRAYLRHLVEPGRLAASRSGLLLLAPPAVDNSIEPVLAEALQSGRVVPAGAPPWVTVPAGRRFALLLPQSKIQNPKSAIAPLFPLRISREERPEDVPFTVRLRMEANLAPALARRTLTARYGPLIGGLKAAVELLPSVRVSDEGLDLLACAAGWLAPDDGSAALRTMEVCRGLAALAGRETAGVGDALRAVALLLGDCRPSGELDSFIVSALLDRIGPLILSLLNESGGTGNGARCLLLRNPPPGFADALRARMERSAPERAVVPCCGIGCAPDGSAGFCPECGPIASVNGGMDEEKAPVRVAVISSADSPVSLVSSFFLSRVIVPGKLGRANRGLLLIEDAGRLLPDAADVLGAALDAGTVPVADSHACHPFSATTIAFVNGDAGLHPSLARHFTAELDLAALAGGVLAEAVAERWAELRGARSAIRPGAATPLRSATGAAERRNSNSSEPPNGPEARNPKSKIPNPQSVPPTAPENLLDMVVRAGSGVERCGPLSLLRLSRAVAASRGKRQVDEGDVGAAAGLLHRRMKGDAPGPEEA